jgi:hypothetical protein
MIRAGDCSESRHQYDNQLNSQRFSPPHISKAEARLIGYLPTSTKIQMYSSNFKTGSFPPEMKRGMSIVTLGGYRL